MDKRESIAAFLKSLELSLKHASIYFEEHPAFIKSVEDIQKKVDALINFLNPIRIYFTPQTLLIDGEHWEKERIYKELATTFHRRLIKSLEIRKGITPEELRTLITQVNLSPKNIMRQGGLNSILKKEKITHITVEGLDYSQMLKGEGEEIKDIWEYFLNEALESQDSQKIFEVTDNFNKAVAYFKADDFLKNKDLIKNIERLFSYLKEREENKFRNCAKVLMKSILKEKDISKESKLDALKDIFKGLNEDDFASTLWEELTIDKGFDSLSFNIFVKLTEKNKQQGIANSLAGLIEKEDLEGIQPQVGEKIKDLLSSVSTQIVPETYRKILSSIFKDISFRKELSIDRELLQKNYLLTLLELLDREKREECVISILEKISEGWDRIVRKEDFEFISNLVTILKNKNGKISSQSIRMGINKKISHIIETKILKGEISPNFAPVIDYLEESSFNVDVYITKIFIEKLVNPYILQSYFKFFPGDMDIFIQNLKGKKFDKDFLIKTTESLQSVDSRLSLFCLESIFSLSNNQIKLLTLKAMQKLPKDDKDFLLDVLKKKSIALKREALLILVRSQDSKVKAIELLLSIRSPFGAKNKILRENITLIEEMNLREARHQLILLSKKKFLWHKNIRSDCLRVLRIWNEREDKTNLN